MLKRFRVCIYTTILAFVLAGFTSVVASTAVAPPASADATPALPATATTDILPAPQIDGVVWKQVIVGNTVYVGGEFQNARPFGSPSGVNTVTRSNMLAYNLTTGALDTSFAPSFNAKVNDMAVTPDHTKLVVVGTFSSVSGATRNHVAVFNLPADGAASGATLSTTSVPTINGETTSVAASNSTFYFGGWFSAIDGASRARIGAVTASNGKILPFTVPVDNNWVQSLVVSPDASSVVLAGNFTSVGGNTNPGFGLYKVDATTGAPQPLPVNAQVYSGGANAGFQRLASDTTSFYGTAWNYNGTGNTEGVFQASWQDGTLTTLDDCHGDSYDAAPIGDVVYVASHKHYCGNSGGFPQTEPNWTPWHATAWTKAPMGTNTGPDIYGYKSSPGTPHGQLLNFFPQFVTGTYTGKGQATWTVTGNSQYVLYGGEFLKVDGTSQQGIVRFGTRAVSPAKVGPRTQSGSNFTPNAQSYSSGAVHVSWPALWDREDTTLTYQLFRDDSSTKIYETTQTAYQWTGQSMSFTDTGLTPGSSHRYAVRVLDSDGNLVNSNWETLTVAGSNTLDPYSAAVLGDGASKYWRLDDTGASTEDTAGADVPNAGAGVTRGTPGAMTTAAPTDNASTFNGTTTGEIIGQNLLPSPTTFSQEVWFKTTSTAGGMLAGYSDASSGDGGAVQGLAKSDRMIYMDTTGHVLFGVLTSGTSTSGRRVITSAAKFNNGAWHQAVSTLGPNGMALYVDGKSVGTNAIATSSTAIVYGGYWRVGGGYTWSGSKYFNGSLDDYSINPSALMAAQVLNHYNASGRGAVANIPPVASFTTSVNGATAAFNASASSDFDGSIASYAWDYGDSSPAGTGVMSSHTYTKSGLYLVKLTVTDDKGASTSTTNMVTVTVPNSPPTASFTATTTGASSSFDASASKDSDGTIASYAWDYGDGTTGAASPSTTSQHTYTKAGTYTVKLTVTDDQGATGSTTQTVTPNATPTASFTQTTSKSSVSVDASGSTDSDGTIASYAWNFGDTNVSGGGTATTQTATYAYSAAGTYTVTLTVTDNSGGTATTTQSVTVAAPNSAPTAVFTATASGASSSFDGTGSSDADGTIASYAWDYGDGTAVSTGTDAKPQHTYAKSGTYTVKLTVTDDQGATGSTTNPVTVTVPNSPPTASFATTTNGLTASVDASGSKDSDGTISTYAWDFGDPNNANDTATGKTATYAYSQSGTYTVTLTVTDDGNATGTTTSSVTVSSVPFIANDTFNRTVVSGWGNADTGGPWSLATGTAAKFAVKPGAGTISLAPSSTQRTVLGNTSSTSATTAAEFTLDKVPTGTGTGDGLYVGLIGRRVGSDEYSARLTLDGSGNGKLLLLRDSVSMGTYTVPGTFTAATKYTLKIAVTGTNPVTVSAKVWPSAGTEPSAWQVTKTDTGTSAPTVALQAAGSVGIWGYAASGSTNVTSASPLTLTLDSFTSQ